MDSKKSEIKELIALLGEKKVLLKEILRLYAYYQEFCKEDKLDKLYRLIKSQSLRVDKIKEIDKKIDRLSFYIKKSYVVQGLEKINTKNEILNILVEENQETDNLLNRIHKNNQKNQVIVKDRYLKLREKLLRINRGKQARNGYIKKGSRISGVFVNRQEKKKRSGRRY